MAGYTREELEAALYALSSTSSKCQKALLKLKEGTSQHTLTTRRIKALEIACELVERELGHEKR